MDQRVGLQASLTARAARTALDGGAQQPPVTDYGFLLPPLPRTSCLDLGHGPTRGYRSLSAPLAPFSPALLSSFSSPPRERPSLPSFLLSPRTRVVLTRSLWRPSCGWAHPLRSSLLRDRTFTRQAHPLPVPCVLPPEHGSYSPVANISGL